MSNLAKIINSDKCQNTKYVIGGYSQGAIVSLKGLKDIDQSKIIYIATFGDPKVYFPEGAGLIPSACRGENLSDYRIYVPDCYAHKGILGAREPYIPDSFQGKVGTWCNKRDILCSSHYSIMSHTSYAEDGLYEDASRLIFSKIAGEFKFQNEYTSPHDTAILIDSTGSMSSLIDQYKAEAMRLAEKTLAKGGRVALYDYRDLSENYTPVERCSFATCSLESFRRGLDSIQAENGGDDPESLLSASLHVMKSLDWKVGSTKSLVILTDAGYHSPDLDGTTFYDVKSLSQKIDPVNFYIITTEDNRESYQSLADATDGAVTTTVDDLSLLSDAIISRFDSLPRVEESTNPASLPTLSITGVESIAPSEYKTSFTTTGSRTLVFLNDAFLGVTDQTEITISELNPSVTNTLYLVPITDDMRGDPAPVNLNEGLGGSGLGSSIYRDTDQVKPTTAQTSSQVSSSENIFIPKAPDTGRPKSTY